MVSWLVLYDRYRITTHYTVVVCSNRTLLGVRVSETFRVQWQNSTLQTEHRGLVTGIHVCSLGNPFTILLSVCTRSPRSSSITTLLSFQAGWPFHRSFSPDFVPSSARPILRTGMFQLFTSLLYSVDFYF